jgi:hypothetical protein
VALLEWVQDQILRLLNQEFQPQQYLVLWMGIQVQDVRKVVLAQLALLIWEERWEFLWPQVLEGANRPVMLPQVRGKLEWNWSPFLQGANYLADELLQEQV